MEHQHNHKLSEEEIDQIVDKVCDKLEQRIMGHVGRGVLVMAWKGFIMLIIAIAGYGAVSNFWK